MLEKYFVLGVFAALLLCIALLFGSIVVCLRLRHLKKLALLNVLRRQQLMLGQRYFSTYLINSAINRLFWRFSQKSHAALADLVGGRTAKAAAYFSTKDKPLALLLSAHSDELPPVYQKLYRCRKKLKALYKIAAAGIAHILFADQSLTFWLKQLKKQHLSLALQAEKSYIYAITYLQEGDMLSASEHASAALKIFKKKRYIFEEAKTYLLLAEIYRISCVNDIAQTMLESALKIFQEAKLPLFQAQTTALLGMLMLFENRFEEAEDKFTKALAIHQDKLLKADIFNQIALLKLARKDVENALKTAKTALKLHKQAQNNRGIAFSRQLIGHFLLSLEFPQKAAAEAQKAAQIYQKQQNFSAYAESLYLQAQAFCKQEQYDKAEKILRQILDESELHSLNFHTANAYSLLGLIYLQKHDLSRAKALLQQSLHLEQNHNRCSGLATDYANLALVENLSGDFNAAAESQKIALEYALKTEDNDLIELIKNAENHK